MPPQPENEIRRPSDPSTPLPERAEPVAEDRANRARSSEQSATYRVALQGVQTAFKKQGLQFNESDVPTLTVQKPDIPPFPILIVLLAVMKDIADIILGIPGDLAGATVIGLVATFSIRALLTAFTLIVATVLFFWVLGKISRMSRAGIGVGKMFVRQYVKRRAAQGAGGLFIEVIFPYFPAATVFVLLAHYHENKYAHLLLSAAEQIGRAYKGGKIKFRE